MQKQAITNKQLGFTIIELMIATTVFSVILLVVSYGLLSIGRSYFKGISSAATQNTARAIVDDIGQSIQFGAGPVYGAGTNSGYYCIGDRMYSYELGRALTRSSDHVLLASKTVCPSTKLPLSTQPYLDIQELVGLNMRLVTFSVDKRATDPTLYNIVVRVVQSDDVDLIEDKLKADGTPGTDGVEDTCKGGIGDQFCAASEIRTTVHKRLN